jgi:hypothetical protein
MSTGLPRFIVTKGNRLPELVVTYVDQDLTGFTLELRLERPSGVLVKTATAVDLTIGRFKFLWAAADFEAGFGQLAQIEVTDTGGLPLTIAEFLFDVRERVE